MDPTPDRAPIIAPPPLLGLACIGMAFLAEHFKPLPIFETKGTLPVVFGALLIVISAAIIISARSVFIAHDTYLNPYRPTNAVVVTGVYRFSRNPIYIAFLFVVLAFALFANSFWFVLFDAILFVMLHFGVVKREEAYLSGKFGDSYNEYRCLVRRWL